MKVLVANLLIGLVAYAWFSYAGRATFVAGAPFGLALLVTGLGLGIWCAQPDRPTRRKKLSTRPTPEGTVPGAADPFESLCE